MTLDDALRWLGDHIAPRAGELDRDQAALADAFDRMAGAGLLGLQVPAPHGLGWSAGDFRAWQQACARASGILAFLQTQHQSACRAAVGTGDGDPDRLAALATGRIRSGIAFSHLRRPGPPALLARRTEGGWTLHGQAPWVTGWGLFTHLATAAVRDDDQRILFVMHPLEPGAGLAASPVHELAAFTVANTVTVTFDGYRVADEQVLVSAPAAWIAHRDRENVAAQGMFALGCAEAGLDVAAAGAGELHGLRHAHASLRAQLLDALGDASRYDEALQLRAQAVALMGRCAHAGVIASAGSANLAHHPAQRVWREALMFTVLAQTRDVRQASLEALAAT